MGNGGNGWFSLAENNDLAIGWEELALKPSAKPLTAPQTNSLELGQRHSIELRSLSLPAVQSIKINVIRSSLGDKCISVQIDQLQQDEQVLSVHFQHFEPTNKQTKTLRTGCR
uniref:HDC12488 n=1 Tax=Drosophila melanogaster TaxID=7227 RepID=Q6IKG8_DROME|nr:TPA_inf: HDC12488 [Drosophila melanogaster]